MAAAYGLDESFAQFWVQDGGTAIAKIDDQAILEEKNANFEELRQFLRMLDVKTYSCTEKTAVRIGYPIRRRGEIMVHSPDGEEKAVGETYEPSLREIYSLFCMCVSENFPVPEFEPFYLDMSFRMRHGAGAAAGVRRDGKLASCALCSAVTDHAAVVAAVATLPEFRRAGLGELALRALMGKLSKQSVYLFRVDGINGEFYRSLDFQPCGRWAEVHLK